ncbi:MAG: hypothetical protein WC806_02815 [Candidatus Gracilibacteria bacterium]|jgi:hypothetical protein
MKTIKSAIKVLKSVILNLFQDLPRVIVLFLLLNFALSINLFLTQAAFALDDPCKDSTSITCIIKQTGQPTKLPSYDIQQHPDAPADYLIEGIGTAMSPIYYLLDLAKYMVNGIAIIVMVIASVKLVTESSDEEAASAKRSMLYGLVGLLLINLADTIVKKVFFGEYGEAFEDSTQAQLFAEEGVTQIRGIIGFVNAFVGATAVFIIIFRGVIVLISPGEEDAITKAKTHITYAIVGLIAASLSEFLVRVVFYPKSGSGMPSVEKASEAIAMITNYMVGFIAIIAFLTLFYAGVLFIVNGQNDETKTKVKNIFIGALAALIISMGAFAAINTIIKFSDTKEPITKNIIEGSDAPFDPASLERTE